jgi:hypothetical protein
MSSWSRTQLTSFAAQGAAQRRETTGQLATYLGVEYCLVMSAITDRRQIEAGGFDLMPSFVARIDVARYPDFAPVLGGYLTVSGVPYLIAEIAPILQGGEIRLALAKA